MQGHLPDAVGIPSCTGLTRCSSWESLSIAPALLIWSPSISPSQPSFSASAMRSGEVVDDLGEPGMLGGVGPEHGAADAGVFVDAGRAERACAGAERDLAAFEVSEELRPFLLGGIAVFLAGRSARRRARKARRKSPPWTPPCGPLMINNETLITTVRWGHFRPSQPARRVTKVGPDQTVTPGPNQTVTAIQFFVPTS